MKRVFACVFLFALVACFQPGDKVCFQSGLNLRTAPCGDIAHTSQQGESGIYQSESVQTCSFGKYTWLKILVNDKALFAAFETGLVYACGGGASKNLDVPMVHQRWDTGTQNCINHD